MGVSESAQFAMYLMHLLSVIEIISFHKFNFVYYGMLYYHHHFLVQFLYEHTAKKDEMENVTSYMVYQKLLIDDGRKTSKEDTISKSSGRWGHNIKWVL
jgi:hypothetical protein